MNVLIGWMAICTMVSASPVFRVVLDPGHGGTQNGAVVENTREADIVLDIAKRVEQQLKGSNVDVLLTRDADVEVTLGERSAIANRYNANLFVSIHANAAPSSELYGIETYSVDIATDAFSKQVAIRENKGAEELLADIQIDSSTMLLSLELADLQQRHLMSTLGSNYADGEVRDLGAKTALFSVLVRTNMPAILIEVGFLTNDIERQQLLTAHYREKIATAIVLCINEWIERNKE